MICLTRISHAGARRIGPAALALLLLVPAAANAQDVLRGAFGGGGSITRWDGVKFGVTLGLTNMNSDFGNATSNEVAYILSNSTLESEEAPSNWTSLPSSTSNSRQYGAFLGYNWQWDQLIVGFDLCYNRASSLQSSSSGSIERVVATSDNMSHDVTIASQASIKLIDFAVMRARAGYAFGQFLPYAFLGGAVGRFNYSKSATVTDIQTPPSGPTVTFGPVTQTDAKDNAIVGGVAAGLGLDVAVLPNVFLRAEWEFIAFAPVGGIRPNINSGRVGIGMKF
jgi:opacity protein-like surface antigen